VTARGRLPVVFPPETDERLSSWLARLATFYAMTVPEFLAEPGLAGCDVFDLEWCLSDGEGALITARTGLSAPVVQAMTFCEVVPDAWIMIARKNRHRCATCPADIHRKAAALPMTFQCAIHGYGFARGRWGHFARHVGSCTVHGAPSACRSGCCCSGLLGPRGRAGAFGAGRDARLFDNTAPPGFATECLGATPVILGARRDYHAFLTTPIIRQALTVIVPQYDRVAVERQPPCPRATTILAGSEAAEVGVFFSFPG